LAFLDESGFSLIPNIQRTWSVKGRTPTLVIAGRWTKISAISAVTVSPKRKRLGLYTRFYANKDIRARQVRHFLRHLCRRLKGPIVLLWDRSPIHKAKLVQRFLGSCPRIHAFHFPGYAPELNPWEDSGILRNSYDRAFTHQTYRGHDVYPLFNESSVVGLYHSYSTQKMIENRG